MDPRLRAADLAPGDRGIAARDWSALTVRPVADAADPACADAFGRLWAEFGGRGEMEPRAVIDARLGWDPARATGGAALLYELLVLRRGADVVAVRDHTAVVLLDDAGRPRPDAPTVVHLSHVLVERAHRGSGVAAWLRALPLDVARRCARVAGRPADAPVVLVAEMEHRDVDDPACMTRLRSYERAGFRKIDPAAAPYCQPDFRPADVLGDAPPEALPLSLVVRRVGSEDTPAMPPAEVAAIVEAIYAVYAPHVVPAALAPVRAAATAWTRREPPFRLLLPTA